LAACPLVYVFILFDMSSGIWQDVCGTGNNKINACENKN
jgi:hypothetical protein